MELCPMVLVILDLLDLVAVAVEDVVLLGKVVLEEE